MIGRRRRKGNWNRVICRLLERTLNRYLSAEEDCTRLSRLFIIFGVIFGFACVCFVSILTSCFFTLNTVYTCKCISTISIHQPTVSSPFTRSNILSGIKKQFWNSKKAIKFVQKNVNLWNF